MSKGADMKRDEAAHPAHTSGGPPGQDKKNEPTPEIPVDDPVKEPPVSPEDPTTGNPSTPPADPDEDED